MGIKCLRRVFFHWFLHHHSLTHSEHISLSRLCLSFEKGSKSIFNEQLIKEALAFCKFQPPPLLSAAKTHQLWMCSPRHKHSTRLAQKEIKLLVKSWCRGPTHISLCTRPFCCFSFLCAASGRGRPALGFLFARAHCFRTLGTHTPARPPACTTHTAN